MRALKFFLRMWGFIVGMVLFLWFLPPFSCRVYATGDLTSSQWGFAATDGIRKPRVIAPSVSNPLFAVQEIARPMISEKAPMRGFIAPEAHLYDIATEPGQVITLRAAN